MINKIKAEIKRHKDNELSYYGKGYYVAMKDCLKWAAKTEKNILEFIDNIRFEIPVDKGEEIYIKIRKEFHGDKTGRKK